MSQLLIAGQAALAQVLTAMQAPSPPSWSAGDPVFGRVDLGREQVAVIAGRPGLGKTTLTCQVVYEMIARNPELRALICNVEMPAHRLVSKQVQRLARVDSAAMRYGEATPDQAARIAAAAGRIAALGDRVAYAADPRGLGSIAAAAAAQRADIVVVDYLQRVSPLATREGAREAVNQVMDELRTLASATADHPGRLVIAVAALKRPGGAAYTRPGLASLRESSEVEYAADDVVLLHAEPEEEERDPDAPPPPRRVLIDHAKNRDGCEREWWVDFDLARQTFRAASASSPVSAPPPPSAVVLPAAPNTFEGVF